MHSPVITIDGPVASGKGTVARLVAEALGFHLLDSGAIYRAFALAALNRKIEINEINRLEAEAKALSLKFAGEQVWVDDVDASAELRSEPVGMAASAYSAIPQVRAALMQRQRDFARAPGLVADGRDMGTIVFTGAELKVYLTATATVRAERRSNQVAAQRLATMPQSVRDELAKQLIGKGKSNTINSLLEAIRAQVLADVESQIRRRDAQDKSRAAAPLKPAPDAIVLDNAAHSPEETVGVVLSLWKLRSASR